MRSSIWLQIFALLIALFMWLQHMLLREQTAQIDVRLEVAEIPDSLTLVSPEAIEAPVVVKARGVDILLLSLGDTRLRVSAQHAYAGRNVVEVNVEDLVTSDYVQKRDMTIRSRGALWYELDHTTRARRPVRLRFKNDDDRSWLARQTVDIEPDSVYVRGPSSRLAVLDAIETEELGRQPTLDGAIDLHLVSPGVLFHIEQEQVEVRLSRPEVVTRDFNQITIRNPYEDRFAIFPGKANLLLEGSKDAFESFDRNDIYISLVSSEPDENGEIALRIEPPSGFRLVSFTPQTVQVIVHEPLPDSGD